MPKVLDFMARHGKKYPFDKIISHKLSSRTWGKHTSRSWRAKWSGQALSSTKDRAAEWTCLRERDDR